MDSPNRRVEAADACEESPGGNPGRGTSTSRSAWRFLVGLGALLALLVAGYRLSNGFRPAAGGGTVTVGDATSSLICGAHIFFNVTFADRDYLEKIGVWEEARRRIAQAQPFVVTANTHVGTVRDLSLDGKLKLVVDGREYTAVERPLQSSTHHNTYLVFFPRYDMNGKPIFERREGSFDVVIEGVEVPERRFTFRFPVATPPRPGDVIHLATLFGAALAGLLVACTPCLVGSLAVGSFTMGTTGSLAGRQARTALVVQTKYYLATLILAYLCVVLLTMAFGLEPGMLRPVEMIGGVLLIIIGVSFLRGWGALGALERVASHLWRRVAGRRDGAAPDDNPLTAGASSAVGASLAMVCSAAGAPTLSTAVILPVLVYAGINDPYWGLLIVLVYLLVCAVPFFLVAVGLGEVLLAASLRWRMALLRGNGLLLIGLGVLLVLSQELLASMLSTPARWMIAPILRVIANL